MSESRYPFLISVLPSGDGSDPIENGKDAVFCWIESAKEFGDEIPQPDSANASM